MMRVEDEIARSWIRRKSFTDLVANVFMVEVVDREVLPGDRMFRGYVGLHLMPVQPTSSGLRLVPQCLGGLLAVGHPDSDGALVLPFTSVSPRSLLSGTGGEELVDLTKFDALDVLRPEFQTIVS